MLQIKPLTPTEKKMAKRFSCSKFPSIQLTQLINTHLMPRPKRSRNLAAAIWEVIATSCPHTLGGQMSLVPQSYQRGNTCTHLSHSGSHARTWVSVIRKVCVTELTSFKKRCLTELTGLNSAKRRWPPIRDLLQAAKDVSTSTTHSSHLWTSPSQDSQLMNSRSVSALIQPPPSTSHYSFQ